MTVSPDAANLTRANSNIRLFKFAKAENRLLQMITVTYKNNNYLFRFANKIPFFQRIIRVAAAASTAAPTPIDVQTIHP